MNFEKFLTKFAKKDVTLDEIKRVEKSLSVRFPDPYRKYLLKYGVAHSEGSLIYGLGVGMNKDSNVEGITIDFREMYPTTATSYVPIFHDGGEHIYCLKCSDPDDSDFGKVFINPQFQERPCYKYNSFEEFLLKRIIAD